LFSGDIINLKTELNLIYLFRKGVIMRKQLLILFVVMLAVFAAIGCTDTEDQPVENETPVDQPTTVPSDEEMTGEEDMMEEEDDIMDEEETLEEEDMMEEENDTMGVEEMIEEDMMEEENDTMDDEEMMGDGETMITIDGDGFAPAETEISVGETVTWTNEDNTIHSVVADDGTFDSGELDEGEEFSYTFDEAGTYQYGSDEDPFFDGTVTVASEEGTTTTSTVTNGNITVPADA